MRANFPSFEKLNEPPSVGDIVYHENHGIVQYRVTDQYSGLHRERYPELVLLEVIKDFGNGWFKAGHLSCRKLDELWKFEGVTL